MKRSNRRRVEWYVLVPCDCEDGSACYATGEVRAGPFDSRGEAEACALALGGKVCAP